MTEQSGEIGSLDLMPWPAWAEAPIEQYLVRQPEQGDWPWEDHCNGLAGGILAALRAAGVVVVRIGDLRGVVSLARGASLPLEMNGWRNDLLGRVDRIIGTSDSTSSDLPNKEPRPA